MKNGKKHGKKHRTPFEEAALEMYLCGCFMYWISAKDTEENQFEDPSIINTLDRMRLALWKRDVACVTYGEFVKNIEKILTESPKELVDRLDRLAEGDRP